MAAITKNANKMAILKMATKMATTKMVAVTEKWHNLNDNN